MERTRGLNHGVTASRNHNQSSTARDGKGAKEMHERQVIHGGINEGMRFGVADPKTFAD